MNTGDIQQNIHSVKYNYYAFLSYSHKDEKWAKWLQRALETYRLPSAIRKSSISIPARISPVFRDKTDLSGTKLRQALHKELDASKFLIVICSPNSAASKYVNEEIDYFVRSGRSHSIIPFIVEGFPNSSDPENECFPPALKNLPEEQLGISVEELGMRGAFLRLISTLLNVRNDQVVMRDKRRRIRNAVLGGIAGALTVCAIAYAIWFNTPHSRYFNAVTFRHEVPVGICPLSEEERGKQYCSYRITTQRGHVIRLETVNAEGTVISCSENADRIISPISEYIYDDNGKLTSIEEKNQYAEVTRQLFLSHDDSQNQIAIDYRLPGNRLNAQAMTSDSLLRDSFDASQASRSEIIRQLNQYDDEGYLTTLSFQKDAFGTPACDGNYVYGMNLHYDEHGQVVRLENLDENGLVKDCKYGWASMEYTYDEKGNVLSAQAYDSQMQSAYVKDGYSLCRMEYDGNSNLVRESYFDTDGAPCYTTEGMSSEVGRYDAKGHLIQTEYFDTHNEPCVSNEYLVPDFRAKYDLNGRQTTFEFYDFDGNPTISPITGYSQARVEMDDAGRATKMTFHDDNGDPIDNLAYGAAGLLYVYNENGVTQDGYFLDANGDPVLSNYQYASFHQTLNEAGQAVRTEYRDAEGNLVRSHENIAIVERDFDRYGNVTACRYYDETETPCNITGGYAQVQYTYENGNLVLESRFDASGEPVLCDENWHRCKIDYDEKGNPIRYTYYNTDGNLAIVTSGYSYREIDYGPHGNSVQIRWYKAGIDSGYAWRDILTYDEHFHLIREVYDTHPDITLKFYAVDYEYSSNFRLIRNTYYNKDGSIQSEDNY